MYVQISLYIVTLVTNKLKNLKEKEFIETSFTLVRIRQIATIKAIVCVSNALSARDMQRTTAATATVMEVELVTTTVTTTRKRQMDGHS